MDKVKRSSGIELLKICAIIIIVLSHAMPYPKGHLGEFNELVYMDLSVATTSIQRFLIVLLKYGGHFANDIFIVSSSWFLLESKHVNIKKTLYLSADCIVASVFFLLIFLFMGYEFPKKVIMEQLTPISSKSYWFITCYILLYLIHPGLNIIIQKLSKEKLLLVNLILIFMYCGINFWDKGSLYYTNQIGFICIYFIVAYVKYYMLNFSQSTKRNLRLLVIATLINFGLIFITNLLILKFETLDIGLTRWNVFINPFNILVTISLFNLAKKNVTFYSKKINRIASLSLLIYIFHCHPLILDYLIGDVFKYIYLNFSYKYEVIWVFIVGILLLLTGLLLGILYKVTLQKVVYKICDCIYKRVSILCKKMICYLLKYD